MKMFQYLLSMGAVTVVLWCLADLQYRADSLEHERYHRKGSLSKWVLILAAVWIALAYLLAAQFHVTDLVTLLSGSDS